MQIFIFCSNGFPYVFAPVFSTPAFSTPAFSVPPVHRVRQCDLAINGSQKWALITAPVGANHHKATCAERWRMFIVRAETRVHYRPLYNFTVNPFRLHMLLFTSANQSQRSIFDLSADKVCAGSNWKFCRPTKSDEILSADFRCQTTDICRPILSSDNIGR